jgi:hypothetical protein
MPQLLPASDSLFKESDFLRLPWQRGRGRMRQRTRAATMPNSKW